MKILFAINEDLDDSLETRILNKYKEQNGYDFEFDKATNLNEIIEALENNVSYDLLVLNEELRINNPVTLEQIKQIKNVSKETRIILIFNSENKDDNFIKTLHNLEIHDFISSEEIAMEKIIDLIMGRDISKTEKNKIHSNRLKLFNTSTEKPSAKVITKEIIKHVPETPHDYKKVVGVLGCKQKGKTTIIDLLATQLSGEKVKVAVLDLTKENSFYRLKCWINQDEGDRGIKRLELLEKGERKPFEIDHYYHIYAQNQFNINGYDIFKAIETLKTEYTIIFVDVSEVRESFKYIFTDIYFVHDLNIIDLKELKESIKEIKKGGITSYKIKIIINKVINAKVKPGDIIAGLKLPLNEIEEEKEENFVDIKDHKVFSIPFSIKLMENALNAAYKGDELVFVPDEIKNSILEISKDIYPTKAKQGGLLKEIFKLT